MSSFSSSSCSVWHTLLIHSPVKLIQPCPTVLIPFPIIQQPFTLSSTFCIKPSLSPSHIRLLVHSTYIDPPNPPDETGLFYSFFGEIGLSENQTSLLLQQNPSFTSTAFDSVRTRVSDLESVGIQRIELYRLIIKCPYVLTAPEIHRFLHYIRYSFPGKIEPAQLKRLLAATEPRFLVDFDEKVGLLINHGLAKDNIVHVLNKVNLSKAICLKSIQEIDRTLAFFVRYGGVDIIVRRPTILHFDLDLQLIPRVEFLMELSARDEQATGCVLRKLPAILSYSVEHTKDHVDFLRSFAGFTDPQIFKIFLVFPNVISASKERKLLPRIELLKQCGLNSDEIFKLLSKAPLFLGLSFKDNIEHKLVILVKIGYRHKTKDLAMALGAVTRTSCENLQKVIGLFFSYGLCCEDIRFMSKKHPQILQYTYASLEEKMDYLIEGMGREIGELLAFPAFLGYKLDDRIKHRYEVKRKVLGEKMSLNKLLSVSALRFSATKKTNQPTS
ncbi:Transcription termination factor MTERF8 chloroplastic [Euphorbia peplus]|nr:Transcription termination factor MTERF8 chloroplastic [Euphorbia peplus]